MNNREKKVFTSQVLPGEPDTLNCSLEERKKNQTLWMKELKKESTLWCKMYVSEKKVAG